MFLLKKGKRREAMERKSWIARSIYLNIVWTKFWWTLWWEITHTYHYPFHYYLTITIIIWSVPMGKTPKCSTKQLSMHSTTQKMMRRNKSLCNITCNTEITCIKLSNFCICNLYNSNMIKQLYLRIKLQITRTFADKW